jgi:hypothetical protein
MNYHCERIYRIVHHFEGTMPLVSNNQLEILHKLIKGSSLSSCKQFLCIQCSNHRIEFNKFRRYIRVRLMVETTNGETPSLLECEKLFFSHSKIPIRLNPCGTNTHFKFHRQQLKHVIKLRRNNFNL